MTVGHPYEMFYPGNSGLLLRSDRKMDALSMSEKQRLQSKNYKSFMMLWGLFRPQEEYEQWSINAKNNKCSATGKTE